ncbi:hypothetical protein A2960_02970 [Candidatus Gottesmanbacteria bacterium RIFCSPLOWO2_01_FULL_39_12b]|uniref:Cohesin domain-containing protein n=1 Tax=Candidatus Gottesmanbacteria bacterium RIFCSPLOWO2_01_FULL_39_12b TaxID=1798388 RepID=A0A1F6AS19_9BACT|nr:MAG: hypothetical protein A2960_02970 [Candidatus Gottesmanbacteria bacterium RIFCSPLOWO2_01_FULL_39_12b]
MKIIVFILVLVSALIFSSSSVFATEASLKCTPSTATYKVGDTFTVDYNLDTRTFPVFGANVVATYDPSILQVVGTSSTPVTTSTQWGTPVTNTIDSTLGKITLDYSNTQPSWTGSSSIGQVTFKTKTTGQAQFNFVFFQQYDDTTPGVAKVWSKKDGTNLSNILTDVNNCLYVISGVTPSPTNAPPGPTATSQPTVPPVTELPRSGNTETTVSLLGLAGLFLIIGSVMPAIVLKSDY